MSEYYAQPAESVVGRRGGGYDSDNDNESMSTTTNSAAATTTTTPFSSILGEWHWRRIFRKMYEEREGHWLTPVELFKPHYSHILGNFCAQNYDTIKRTTTSGFEIVELGCGRGTNANLILTYLKGTKPDVYESLISYTLVDASPSLHKLQQKALLNGPHADKVQFQLKDLMDVADGT